METVFTVEILSKLLKCDLSIVKRYFSKIIVLGRLSSGFVSDLTETLDNKLLVFGKQKRDTVFFRFSNDKA